MENNHIDYSCSLILVLIITELSHFQGGEDMSVPVSC